MNRIANIIGPFYQDILMLCEKLKISINLDLENPSLHILDEERLRAFLRDELTRAFKGTKAGDKITISQVTTPDNRIKFSVKSSGKFLTQEQKARIRAEGLEVSSRYGYGTTISIILN